MKPEDIAKLMEDELRRNEEASANKEDENEEMNESVVDSKEKNKSDDATESKNGSMVEKELKEKIKKVDLVKVTKTLSKVIDNEKNVKCDFIDKKIVENASSLTITAEITVKN